MNIQEIVNDLKQIAAECEKVTSGNVSHKIANIEHGILNIADYLENYCPLGWHPASDVNGLMNLVKRLRGDLTTKPKLWIAREQDGDLYLFNNKPIRDEDGYWVDSVDLRKDFLSDIDRDWFCEVTYENSPREVELELS